MFLVIMTKVWAGPSIMTIIQKFVRKQNIVERALEEDIGVGDVTTLSIIPEGIVVTAHLVAQDKGVFAGVQLLRDIYTDVDVVLHCVDGDYVKKGTLLAVITGDAHIILSRERVALNFLQRLSGIATLTRRFVNECAHNATILDTRKTTPGLRKAEKYAVRVGGGQNHRFGLYDMVLIKDNHIRIAGSIAKAVKRARTTGKKVEVEVEHFKQLVEAVACKPDMIMLDNMSLDEMKRAVKYVHKKIPLEASGNMTISRIKEVSKIGIDYISVGALTHSAQALNMHMEIV